MNTLAGNKRHHNRRFIHESKTIHVPGTYDKKITSRGSRYEPVLKHGNMWNFRRIMQHIKIHCELWPCVYTPNHMYVPLCEKKKSYIYIHIYIYTFIKRKVNRGLQLILTSSNTPPFFRSRWDLRVFRPVVAVGSVPAHLSSVPVSLLQARSAGWAARFHDIIVVLVCSKKQNGWRQFAWCLLLDKARLSL